MPKPKEKIAILGGGLGSLITAACLTSGKNKDKYDITVYQHGWRLGGKGASGRNAGCGQRIEEHGLHIWFGCYENAFALFRPLLAEWDLPTDHPWNVEGPENRWRHAFKPANSSVVVENRADPSEQANRWERWNFDMPVRENGEPGDGKRLYDGFWSLLGELSRGMGSFADRQEGKDRKSWRRVRPVKGGVLGWLWTLITLPLRLWQLFRAWRVGHMIHGLIKSDIADDPFEAFRKMAILLDLGLAIFFGLLRNFWKICLHSLDALDETDLRQFLRDNGASEESVNSPVISSIYDAVFAQIDGEPTQENFAAGAGLRSMLRILIGYKHAMFYKMQAGMGDTVFTPLFEVLKARGVKFRFFHQVKSLELAGDRRSIMRVRIARQVTLVGGGADYDPLLEVEKIGCWPSEPRWEQIVEAAAIQQGGHNLEHANNGWPEREEIVLEKREGEADGELVFDRVVLGISIGAFPVICRELIDANPKFKAMVDHVRTVRTEAAQLWLRTDLAGLGWHEEPPVFGNFTDPLNTWADMTHLIPREVLDPAKGIRNVAYLCGPMPESVPPDGAAYAEHVQQSMDAAIDGLAATFWPGAADASRKFDRSLIAMKYLRWNVTPSDRYVLTVSGSTKYRLRPGESGFSNLTLTGDWTRNGWNAGCVEATVMSGMLASHAISGYPKRKQIAYVNGP